MNCINKLLIFILFLLCPSVVLSDEVKLKNGDRFTGEILKMENKILVLKTSYAGIISIDWGEVVCLDSLKDLKIVLHDGRSLKGRSLCSRERVIQIVGIDVDKEKGVHSVSDFRAINSSSLGGFISLGGRITDGNTERKGLNFNSRVQTKENRHQFSLEGKYNYGENKGAVDTNNMTGGLKYDFFHTRKLYTYAQILAERDMKQNLRLRQTDGLGIGYQLFDARPLKLLVETGGAYFYEDYEDGRQNKENAAVRWSASLNCEIIDNRLKLYHFHEGYYSPDSSSLYVRSEQGLRFPLSGGFSINLGVDYKYNSHPEEYRQKYDVMASMGLRYDIDEK